MSFLLGVFLLYFFNSLIIALIPCVIQLLLCLFTNKIWIRMIPIVTSSIAMSVWAVLIITEHFPLELFGFSKYWFQWVSMLAALMIAHGLPFLILGQKK